MKKIIVILLTLINTAATADVPEKHLIYRIKPLAHSESIEVTLFLRGSASGKTTLRLPQESAGVQNLYEDISFLEVQSKYQSLIFDESPYLKTITHVPKDELKIKYRVKQRFKGQPKTDSQARLPLFQPKFFHFIGEMIFIYPNSKTFRENWQVKLHWDLPQNWKVANSFGANDFSQTIRGGMDSLVKGLFLGGELLLFEHKIKDLPVWLAFSQDFEYIEEAALSSTLEKLISSQRAFFQEAQRPYYLIGIVGYEKKTSQIGGREVENAFVLYLPDKLDSQETSPLYRLAWLISHEHFHQWNKPKLFDIQNPKDEAEYYWFTEGLTDYYADLFLLKTGIGDYKDYLAEFNDLIQAYYTSSVRSLSNEETKKRFWQDKLVEQLPYQKGNLLAHNWNAEIRANSNNQKSLGDFIKKVLKPEKTKSIEDPKLSLEKLDEISKEFIPGGISEDLHRYIDKGVLIEPHPLAMGPCAIRLNRIIEKPTLGSVEMPQFQLDENLYLKNAKYCWAWFGLE